MNFIDGLIKFFKTATSSNEEVTFLKYFFPIITILGGATLLYYGFKGVVYKSTINLSKIKGLTFSESAQLFGEIKGGLAVYFGIIYIIMGLFLSIILGGISYYTWF